MMNAADHSSPIVDLATARGARVATLAVFHSARRGGQNVIKFPVWKRATKVRRDREEFTRNRTIGDPPAGVVVPWPKPRRDPSPGLPSFPPAA